MLKYKKLNMISRVFLLILFVIKIGTSQSVNVTPTITPPYPIYLEDILTFDYGVILTLNNFSSQSESLKLIASLEGDNGVTAVIKDSYTPTLPIQLGPNGTVVLTSGDLQRLFSNITQNNVEFSGIDQTTLLQTEKLPEGVYQLCIKALDYNTGEIKSMETAGCTSFYITDYDPPIITNPLQDDKVTPKNPQTIMFSWVSTGLPQFTKYKIEIVDMTLNNLLDPNDAFGNISIILHYQKQDLLQTNLFYDASMPNLLENHEYAVRVTASDPSQNISFKNNGQSEVISFKYQKSGSINYNDDLDIEGGGISPQFAQNICNTLTAPADKTAVTDVSEYDVLKIGDHDLKVFDISWQGDKLSGEGKIINSYLKVPILVEFEGLKVNAAHQVFEGTAFARADDNVPSQWLNDLGDVDFAGGDITNVIEGLLGGNNDRIIEYPYSNLDSVGLGMPIGINRNIAGTDQLIAVVGMSFSSLGAGLNAVGDFDFPKYDKHLRVGASGVCFDKSGFTKDAFLYLIDDITFNQNGKFQAKFDKGIVGDSPDGTYITMQSEGFKEAQLAGEFLIDESLIKPVDDNLDQVIITFDALVENPKSIILDNIDVTPFEITKLPGFEVTVSNMSVDLSDSKNPDAIVFPTDDYNGNEGNLWQGFYIGTCDIKLPEKLQNNGVLEASNFVIDKNGFSGIIESANVFDTETGKLGTKKWKWSMENLYVEVLQNTLNAASFEGDIRVPITKDDVFMKYETNISTVNNDLTYNFSIINQEAINFPAIIAQGTIDPLTRIELNEVNGVLEPEFHLFGFLKLDKSFAYKPNEGGFLPPIDIDSLIVQDLIVSSKGISLGPDGAVSFSYNSSQRKFNGFDLNIDSTAIKLNSLEFWISLDLIGETNAVGAAGSFAIKTKYEDGTNMLRYDKIKVGEISVEGSLSVAEIEGKIEFKDDDIYGVGLYGALQIELKLGEQGESIGGGAIEVMFGKMPANVQPGVDEYKYFYFLGSFNLAAGIPISASLRLRGLKGGMYLNMVQDGDMSTPPTPYKGDNNDTKFGLMAGVDIGLSDARAFHAKPQLLVQFGTNSGLDIIKFYGDAYVMTDYQSTFDPYPEGTSPVHIKLDAMMNFKKKVFSFDCGVTVAYKPGQKNPFIKAGGSIAMMISPQNWWLKMGVPGDPKNIGVEILGLFKKQHYFMAGTDLPSMPSVPQEILTSLTKKGKSYSSNREDVGNSSNLKFAFGSLFDMSTDDLEAWIFYAKFQVLFGYDVMIAKNFNPVCGIGKNNWYLRGQAYGKFAADVGIKAKIFGKERKLKLAYIDVTALVELGLPNPAGIKANLVGYADFMGIIKGDFTFEAEQGEICQPVQNNPLDFDDFQYIQDFSAKGDKVSVFADPEVSLLFSGSGRNYTLQEVVDGEEKSRKFRFPVKSAKLYINDKDSDDNGKVLAQYKKNGLQGSFNFLNNGERLIYDSDAILPGATILKLEITVEVHEKINNSWVNMEDVKNTHKTFSFKTKKAPDHIVPENVSISYPERGQRYYLQDELLRNGYIHLFNGQDNIFKDVGSDEIKIRFIPVGGGSIVQGTYVKYENNTIHFVHKELQNKKKYVFQMYRKGESYGGGAYNDNQYFATNDFNAKMTKKFKLLKDMKLSSKDTKIFEYVFGVSKYDNATEKLQRLTFKKGMLKKFNNLNPSTSISLATYTALEEGFDEADEKQMTPKWFVMGNSYNTNKFGEDAGHAYYEDYLKPEIYDVYNKTVKSIAAPPFTADLELDLNIKISNPEPLISNKEIMKILANPVGQGIQIGLAPTSKNVNFVLHGLHDANNDYNTLVKAFMSPEYINFAISKGNQNYYKFAINWAKKNKNFKYFDKNKNAKMLLFNDDILDSSKFRHSKSWKLTEILE